MFFRSPTKSQPSDMSILTAQPSYSYTISPVGSAGRTPALKWFMPVKKLEIDHFSLVSYGGYADIYKSKTNILCNDGLMRQLGLKVFRVAWGDSKRVERITSIIDDLKNHQSLVNINHSSLCPLEIINAATTGDLYAIVMPWYENGLNHVRQHPSANRSNLVIDMATGLKHLHSVGLVHGNLCLENILVTDCGRACLTDVGVNLLAIRAFCDGYNPVPAAWSYKAPEELLLGIRDQRSDIYSLACTLYAIYIENPPFQPLPYPYFSGIERIIGMGHLQLIGPPVGICEDLWSLLQACWNKDPAGRPTIVEVEHRLREILHD